MLKGYGNGISEPLDLKISWEGMPPDPPIKRLFWR